MKDFNDQEVESKNRGPCTNEARALPVAEPLSASEWSKGQGGGPGRPHTGGMWANAEGKCKQTGFGLESLQTSLISTVLL